jgi:two-component system sensor histidine kinase DesK
MLFRFVPTEEELARCRSAGFASAHDLRTYSWLNLVWSVFIFLTPWFADGAFPHWLWPTLASFAAFLWLYFRTLYRREGETVIRYAIAIGALGFLLTPFNSGGQSYLIYACAFFAFTQRLRDAILLMAGMISLYMLEWQLLGYPWEYVFSALVIGPVVLGMNLVYKRNQQRNAELKLSNEEVRRLAALAERERIGRDLHDLLGHTLSLITLKSELASRLFDRDPQAARREIVDVERVARDALSQVRHAVTGIRAAGIAAELASAKLLLESNSVRMEYALCDVALPLEIETTFALTIREAVTNVQRHARAHSTRIVLEEVQQTLQLRIADDGRGDAIVPGNGLTGMRERLAGIGAELRIVSERGRGTTLTVVVPMPRAASVSGPAASQPALRAV